ncbi:hypothetical protein FPT12_21045 [Pseudomonas sp. H3(2019)]|nr:hypothetical protein FPT12_21045 [Pseudomonas sp. H3(2019)]
MLLVINITVCLSLIVRGKRCPVFHGARSALGERGPVWWDDGSPDFNSYQVGNTPYAEWYLSIRH